MDTVREMAAAFGNWRLWVMTSWVDIRTRYRRTIVGPLWLSLGTGIGLAGMGFVWAMIFGMELRVFFPYMMAGYITWMMWAEFLSSGCNTFISGEAATALKDIPMNRFIHPLRLVTRTFITYAHNIVIFIITAVVAQSTDLNFNVLLVCAGLVLTFLNGVWLTTFLGMIGARYRDLSPLISSLLIFLFMATPIMWNVDMVRGREFIAYYNPMFHLLEIVRAPLLGQSPALLSWAVAVTITFVGSGVTLLLFHSRKGRIVFWV